ncbi:MAG: hypothetical protein HGA27_00220 [Peptococcaceae bacterium]|nr:hypothetical protein [Peptococcaceae bacterium]
MYKYYNVPVVDGGIEDREAYPFIPESIQNETDIRLIKINADYPPGNDWTEISEEEYNVIKEEMLITPEVPPEPPA